VEYAEVYGNHYGTLKSEVYQRMEKGQNVVLDIDSQGAMMVLEHRTGAFHEPDERFQLYKVRAYGDTEIHFYLYEPENQPQKEQKDG